MVEPIRQAHFGPVRSLFRLFPCLDETTYGPDYAAPSPIYLNKKSLCGMLCDGLYYGKSLSVCVYTLVWCGAMVVLAQGSLNQLAIDSLGLD